MHKRLVGKYRYLSARWRHFPHKRGTSHAGGSDIAIRTGGVSWTENIAAGNR
jgi:hypothetical protein